MKKPKLLWCYNRPAKKASEYENSLRNIGSVLFTVNCSTSGWSWGKKITSLCADRRGARIWMMDGWIGVEKNKNEVKCRWALWSNIYSGATHIWATSSCGVTGLKKNYNKIRYYRSFRKHWMKWEYLLLTDINIICNYNLWKITFGDKKFSFFSTITELLQGIKIKYIRTQAL